MASRRFIGTKFLQVAVWLLPASRLKNKILSFFGHEIAHSAYIGPILAFNLGHVIMGEECRINTANIFRSLRLLKLEDKAGIGQLNTISAFPGFSRLDRTAGCLVMRKGAFITSRHYIDCSGGVEMGEFSALYGQRTTLLTHEIDMSTNEQTAGSVTIGARSSVLTNCVILKGAYLPPRSLLAAHSTMLKSKGPNPPEGLYAGTPARCIRPVPVGPNSWFEREESATTQLRVDNGGRP